MIVQKSRAVRQSDEWYLIANRDNLSVRIRDSVTVGEDEFGQLTFDDKDSAARWVTLQVSDGEHLTVVHQDPRVRMACPGQWIADNAGATLIRGTLLQLPHNEIYLSQHIRRGQPTQTVHVGMAEVFPPILVEEPEATTDENAGAPVAPVEAVQEAANDILADAIPTDNSLRRGPTKAAKIAEAAPIPKPAPEVPKRDSLRHRLRAAAEAQSESGLSLEPMETIELQDVEPVYAPPHRRRAAESVSAPILVGEPEPQVERPRGSMWPWIGVAAVVLISAYIVNDRMQDSISEPTPTGEFERLASESGESTVALGNAGPNSAAPTALQGVPGESSTPPTSAGLANAGPIEKKPLPEPEKTLASKAVPQAAVERESTPPAVSVAPVAKTTPRVSAGERVPTLNVEVELIRARRMLDQGFISWPEENAVLVAQRILRQEPNNRAAQTVLADAATILIDEALQAHADGFEGAAVETIEGVLKFDPNHPRAIGLHRLWTVGL